MRTDVEIEGLERLTRVMQDKLPEDIQLKVLRRSLRLAGEPMRKRLKQLFDQNGASGSLATAMQSWSVRKGLRRGGPVSRQEIGPRRSNKRALAQYYDYYGRAPTPKQLRSGIRHGHLAEFGFQHESGKRVQGKGLMGRVFDAHGVSTIRLFRKIFEREIDKAILKHAGPQVRTA